MKTLNFIKMHGLGNDFIIIDKRKINININKKIIRKISNRKTGIGCDQVIIINKSLRKKSAARIKIFNSNGSEAESCGNGIRCVSKLLFKNKKRNKIILDSIVGELKAILNKNKSISVNMGIIKENWKNIPMSKKINNRNIPINIKNFSKGFAVNIGNPHIVFFGKEINNLDISVIGPKIENHNLFPNKINVEFVEIVNRKKIKMRVWERAVGETLACGSGACAAVYAGLKKEMIGKKCEVILKKGSLFIDITKNNEIIMTGPAEISYHGKIIL